MTDIFLSFSRKRNIWKETFVERSLIGTKLRVLDYETAPLVAGDLNEELDARIKNSAGFVALIDESYTRSDACLTEFDCAVKQFGIGSERFGSVILDTPGRDFVTARFKAAGIERIFVDLASPGGDGPRDLNDEKDIQTIRRFAEGFVNAIARTEAHPIQRLPRVIVLGVPAGQSSTKIVTLRAQLTQGLSQGGIDVREWGDDWTVSGPPDFVTKALLADHPPIFVLPIDRSLALYYKQTTLQELIGKALDGSAIDKQRQLPKCVVWCRDNSPPHFGQSGAASTNGDDALRNDSQAKLIEWLRAELGIATWKTAVISVEGFKKSGEKSAANRIGRRLKDILLPAVKDVCRPPEPVVTSFFSFEEKAKATSLESELARQLKQFVGSGVAILTIHDLSLDIAPDWPTAYNDLQQKISRYQKLINRITDQNLLDISRIVKLAIVMTNREFRIGSEIFAEDDKVGWKVIGMSDRGDGTIEVEAEDSAILTDAVCSVVSTL